MHPPRVSFFCLILAALVGPGDAVLTRAEGGTVPSTEASLFFPGAVCPIQLHLSREGREHLRRAPRDWVRARVEAPGFSADDVAVHLKGRVGSFQPIDDPKPGFTLDFARFQPGRTFRGFTRLHLNNAVEDPTLLHAQLGAALFEAEGIPAARVTHARVSLDDRPLGLYVLQESYEDSFLRHHGLPADTILAEAESGGDLDAPLTIKWPAAERGTTLALPELNAALAETNSLLPAAQLDPVLDRDRALTFVALEVLLGHRDGYSLAANNYRVLQAPENGRVILLPHGFDQLFGNPTLPWKPSMGGHVARALLFSTAGTTAYEQRFRALHDRWLAHDAAVGKLDELFAALRPALTTAERRELHPHIENLRQRIRARASSLTEQLDATPEPRLVWTGDVARVIGWRPAPSASPEASDAATTAELSLSAVPGAPTSWRARVRLAPGRYRFVASVRTEDVEPLPHGHARGAGVRLGGQSRGDSGVTGTTPPTSLALDFSVFAATADSDVELICELRARRGRAWFDRASLRLERLPAGGTASEPISFSALSPVSPP